MTQVWTPGATDTHEITRHLCALLGRYADPRLTRQMLNDVGRGDALVISGVAALQNSNDTDQYMLLFVTPDGLQVQIEVSYPDLSREYLDTMIRNLTADLAKRRAERRPPVASVIDQAVNEELH